MSRKLKTIGVALVAVFAMSAIAASAAQAAEEFRSESPANGKDANILTGEVVTGGPTTVSEPHVFLPKPGGVKVTCKMAAVKGTNTGTTAGGTLNSPTATVTPEYSECEIPGLAPATVTTTGCHYKFYAETTRETEAGVKQGKSEIICETGKVIEVSGGGCIIKIGTQSPGGGVNYVNTGSGSTADIDAEAHVTNIAFETNGAFGCSLVGIPKTGTEGTYLGNVTAKGFTDNNSAANEGKTGIYEEGAQLGIKKE